MSHLSIKQKQAIPSVNIHDCISFFFFSITFMTVYLELEYLNILVLILILIVNIGQIVNLLQISNFDENKFRTERNSLDGGAPLG